MKKFINKKTHFIRTFFLKKFNNNFSNYQFILILLYANFKWRYGCWRDCKIQHSIHKTWFDVNCVCVIGSRYDSIR